MCLVTSVESDSLQTTLWTLARQAPLSLGFSQQEYWDGLLFPPPRGLPGAGIKYVSPASLALKAGFFITEPPGKHSGGLAKEARDA